MFLGFSVEGHVLVATYFLEKLKAPKIFVSHPHAKKKIIELEGTSLQTYIDDASLPNGFFSLYRPSLSLDGKVVANTVGQRIELWDLRKARRIEELSYPANRDINWICLYSRFSPGSQHLAAVFSSVRENDASVIAIWDLHESRRINAIAVKPKSVGDIALSHDGKTLAAVSGHSRVLLWKCQTGTAMKTLECPTQNHTIRRLAFSPKGNVLVACCGTDRPNERRFESLILWDLRTGARRELAASSDWTGLAFSTDGKIVAVGRRGLVTVATLE